MRIWHRWLIAGLIGLTLWSVPRSSAQYVNVLNTSTLIVTAVSAANAAVTATLPAPGAATFQYITNIQVTRTCTTAIVGSAVLTVTTTNLPGTPAFTMGNACPVGTTNRDVVLDFGARPIRSSVANTATTVVCPAIGATGICRINVVYYTGP